jgi:triosephosphate isomerase
VRRKVVAGNWKMNGSAASIDALLAGLEGRLRGREADVVLFPPSVYLAAVVERARTIGATVGAQSTHAEPRGAFTGEISAEMVRDLGATHVLVGHSERRAGFGETDTIVAAKFAAALRAGLTPVLCVGETAADRDAGRAQSVACGQLDAVLARHGVDTLTKAIVAYEPVWAIGTGRTATPQDAQTMHAALRATVEKRSADCAGVLRILYGGSVTATNARVLLATPEVDGVLVGGASLDAEQFVAIYDAIERA